MKKNILFSFVSAFIFPFVFLGFEIMTVSFMANLWVDYLNLNFYVLIFLLIFLNHFILTVLQKRLNINKKYYWVIFVFSITTMFIMLVVSSLINNFDRFNIYYIDKFTFGWSYLIGLPTFLGFLFLNTIPKKICLKLYLISIFYLFFMNYFVFQFFTYLIDLMD